MNHFMVQLFQKAILLIVFYVQVTLRKRKRSLCHTLDEAKEVNHLK